MKLGAYALTLALISGAVQAQAPETLAWLRKIQDAAQKLSYSGTFVYQSAGRSETVPARHSVLSIIHRYLRCGEQSSPRV